MGAVKWELMHGFLLYAVSPVLLSESLPFKSSCRLFVVDFIRRNMFNSTPHMFICNYGHVFLN